MNNIARLRKGLSPERKRKIAARTATIVAEERSLQEPAPRAQKNEPVLLIGRDPLE